MCCVGAVVMLRIFCSQPRTSWPEGREAKWTVRGFGGGGGYVEHVRPGTLGGVRGHSGTPAFGAHAIHGAHGLVKQQGGKAPLFSLGLRRGGLHHRTPPLPTLSSGDVYRIAVMYGSQTGNAQSIAEGIHDGCKERGLVSTLLACDGWKKASCGGAWLGLGLQGCKAKATNRARPLR